MRVQKSVIGHMSHLAGCMMAEETPSHERMECTSSERTSSHQKEEEGLYKWCHLSSSIGRGRMWDGTGDSPLEIVAVAFANMALFRRRTGHPASPPVFLCSYGPGHPVMLPDAPEQVCDGHQGGQAC